MCNYLGYRVSKEQYIRLKQIEKTFGESAALEELRSGFVYGDWATIVASADKSTIEQKTMHWEFIPNFVKDKAELELYRKGINPKTGVKGIPIPWLNATAENLFINKSGKPAMWADAARKRRCLVLATHFFEWRWYKPEGEKKEISYPYLVDFYSEDEPLFMAGIYNSWADKTTGELIDSFAIVTTEANDVMKVIHNRKGRQPTILTEDLAYKWIMEDLSDDEITQIAKYQLPAEKLRFHTLSKDFQRTGDLSEFEYSELPPFDVAI